MNKRRISKLRIFDQSLGFATSVDGDEYAATRSFSFNKKFNSLNSPLSDEVNSFSRGMTIPADYRASYGIQSGGAYAFSSSYDDIDGLRYLVNLSTDE